MSLRPLTLTLMSFKKKVGLLERYIFSNSIELEYHWNQWQRCHKVIKYFVKRFTDLLSIEHFILVLMDLDGYIIVYGIFKSFGFAL